MFVFVFSLSIGLFRQIITSHMLKRGFIFTVEILYALIKLMESSIWFDVINFGMDHRFR